MHVSNDDSDLEANDLILVKDGMSKAPMDEVGIQGNNSEELFKG